MKILDWGKEDNAKTIKPNQINEPPVAAREMTARLDFGLALGDRG